MTSSHTNCPCRGCGKRTIGCHAKCDDYATWKAVNDIINEDDRLSRDGYTNHDAQPYWRKHRKDSRRGQN